METISFYRIFHGLARAFSSRLPAAGLLRNYSSKARESAAKKIISTIRNSVSCFQRFFSRPTVSRMKALGQYHHLVLLPIPSADKPARAAHTPLRNTW